MPITDPNDLPNIDTWLDAQQHGGADNDPVSTATDYHTGGGHDYTGTGGGRPVVKLNIVNGHPIFRFDGTDDFLSGGASLAGATTYGFYVAHRSGSVAANEYFIIGANGERWVRAANAAPDIFEMSGIVSTVALDTSFHSIIVVYNGASSLIRIDGTETTGTAAVSGADAPFCIGASAGVSQFADIDLGEFVVCTGALDATARADLVSYFESHWAAAASSSTGTLTKTLGAATLSSAGVVTAASAIHPHRVLMSIRRKRRPKWPLHV